ncbi:MAG: hypothetical protein B7Z42_09420 [Brevundimonas sp. 12-68-7]|nr:MAG: hypothetical protein B7Z42_09420 [Brevundimonas sp. 12-68-7]OYX30935.1 MAG: hypothetical protein B7Z01_13350 [Brevundimonas subvibrioides]
MNGNRMLVGFAALNGAMAVAVGAFAAHGAGPQIKTLLTTGASYQLAHALLGLVCAIWPGSPRLVRIAGWLATFGGLIFCLSLSLIGVLSLPTLGAVAPIGGVLMISAWLTLVLAAFRSSSVND